MKKILLIFLALKFSSISYAQVEFPNATLIMNLNGKDDFDTINARSAVHFNPFSKWEIIKGNYCRGQESCNQQSLLRGACIVSSKPVFVLPKSRVEIYAQFRASHSLTAEQNGFYPNKEAFSLQTSYTRDGLQEKIVKKYWLSDIDDVENYFDYRGSYNVSIASQGFDVRHIASVHSENSALESLRLSVCDLTAMSFTLSSVKIVIYTD